MTKKVWVMIGAIAAALVVAACGKSEAYRSIMVYQINGNATITRDRVGEMAAYENLMLQSGDSVAVASESSMRLKLDDDKYILAEQDTLMNIVAEGDDEDSKTYIDLQKGSVTSEIQNKLKDGASYEVNTPNAIMAVRGTIFRVDVEFDADGNPQTTLTVLQGTVAAKALMPDGTISDEEVLVEAGNELTIEGTPTTVEDLGAPKDINYDSLPQIITEYIEELKQSGTKLAQNVAEHSAADADAQAAMQEQNADSSKQQKTEPQEEQQADFEEPEEQEAEQSNVTEKNPENKSKTPEKPQNKPSEEEKPEQSEPQKSEPQESKPQMTEQPEMTPSETEQQKSEAQESEPQGSKPQEPASQTEPSSSQDSSGTGSGSSGDSSDGESGSSGGGSSQKTQYYTVTFQYNGNTFGTQKVKKGEQATEPMLCPTPNGSWDYDFSTKVNKNLVIQWKEQ